MRDSAFALPAPSAQPPPRLLLDLCTDLTQLGFSMANLGLVGVVHAQDWDPQTASLPSSGFRRHSLRVRSRIRRVSFYGVFCPCCIRPPKVQYRYSLCRADALLVRHHHKRVRRLALAMLVFALRIGVSVFDGESHSPVTRLGALAHDADPVRDVEPDSNG
ncbi:hypothetical protein B0H14DRAFT_3454050 [Mycena olivaceomarginata]|nr:hypothetical protein B0H14DRAFT_3454050 [Mycena olivaceomarginata]